MKLTQKLTLEQVLENNKHLPLIVVGALASDFLNAAIISANISVRDLATLNFDIKPMLVIEGLDKVDTETQKNFVTLLKDRGGISKNLPVDVQIIIPVQSKEKLSREILDLSLIWKL